VLLARTVAHPAFHTHRDLAREAHPEPYAFAVGAEAPLPGWKLSLGITWPPRRRSRHDRGHSWQVREWHEVTPQ